ncbi:hypothetical protein MRX96_012260 [Rhipicephalus microplus]
MSKRKAPNDRTHSRPRNKVTVDRHSGCGETFFVYTGSQEQRWSPYKQFLSMGGMPAPAFPLETAAALDWRDVSECDGNKRLKHLKERRGRATNPRSQRFWQPQAEERRQTLNSECAQEARCLCYYKRALLHTARGTSRRSMLEETTAYPNTEARKTVR